MLQRIVAYLLVSIASIMGGGCAKTHHHPQDPLESFNRGVYGFNRALDRVVIKPVSYFYWRHLPRPVQSGVGNFYDNLKELPNIANNILQFKFGYAMADSSRFLINSTVGVLGLFDVAGSLGLEHRKNDFGQTLYTWGYKDSIYLVLPFIGPSTVRDGIGFAVDYAALSIWPWVDSQWRYPLLALDAIDTRAKLLHNEPVMDAVALDEYQFIRDAYFQRRQYLFNQGKGENNDDVDPYENFEEVEKESSYPIKNPIENKETAGKSAAL